MIDRVLLLSHPTLQQENFKFMTQNLITNDYSLDFIFKIINNKIRNIFITKLNHKKFNLDTNKINEEYNKKFSVLPYISGLTHYEKNFKQH